MPDITEFLDEPNIDELEDLIVPDGYWDGVIKGGKVKDVDADDEPYIDKNGKPFFLVFIYIQCNEPAEGVDPALAETYLSGGGPDESLATYRGFMQGRNKTVRLTKLLKKLGVPTTGKSFREIIKGLKGCDVPVKVLVEHEEYMDEIQANVTELLPV